MKNNKLRISLMQILLLIFLYTPIGFLLFELDALQLPEADEFFWALGNSFNQAFLAAAMAVLCGLCLARGILHIEKKSKAVAVVFESLCLLPSIAPAIVILLCLLSFIQPYPRNTFGVAFAHAFIYVGLAAVTWAKILSLRLSDAAELAKVEGAGQLIFWRSAAKTIWSDAVLLFLLIFAASFTSLSVPLVVGGSSGTTLEVLILEKLRFESKTGVALSLALCQLMFIGGIFMLSRPLHVTSSKRTVTFFLTSKLMSLLVGVYSLFLPVYLALQIPSGLSALNLIEGLPGEVLQLFGFSVAVGLGVFILLCLLSFGVCWLAIEKRFGFSALRSFVAPSTAILGLALYLISGLVGISTGWVYLYGLSLIAFPFLLKNGLEAQLQSLREEVQAAKTFGASNWLIFSEVMFPNVGPQIVWLSSIGSIWAVGDFALGRIVIEKDAHLAMLVETLMSSYRTEAAFGVLSYLILVFAIIYLMGLGGAYVLRKKYQ